MNDKSEYAPGAEPVSSDKKFEVMANEADGYYRTVVAIATAMMGGSILFLEKIAPHPINWTIPVLAFGWLALLISIFCIADVRRNNLESLRHALECNYEQGQVVDARTRSMSTWAQWTMVTGMGLIATYGLLNLVFRTDEAVPTPRMIVDVIKGPISSGDTISVRMIAAAKESTSVRRGSAPEASRGAK